MTNNKQKEYEEKLLFNIQEYGCQTTTVFGPHETLPDFTYSIGFAQSVGQAEIITFGLTHEIMGAMINEVLDQCKNGLVLKDGIMLDGLLDNHKVAVKAVHPTNIIPAFFNSAIWYQKEHMNQDMDAAFQLVWPGSKDGLFPWEDGCANDVINFQPPLYLERKKDER
ncbi:hypothetical protein LPB140_09405 [Sphingorhabdus lutea]|uniref:DUF4262 domain-containing protein n=1 Tax=Sphingorhabdus lutea TaxID=1913578 RepID=A0A1L3JCX0_9SPHN|nr:DUF4262 domain-containing protein [Sphingorhabdus lutea]APG62970.1 hypothetical protein LPB140_09405 [Sphingorhabdus lutea]